MEKYELGLNKKSFSLYYNGGEIWCEHLDSMCRERQLVIQKFDQDLEIIGKPSTSSYVAINLDETEVDEEMVDHILNSLRELKKPLRKVAFVGLSSKMKRYLKSKDLSFEYKCIDDFEKAKQWLI